MGLVTKDSSTAFREYSSFGCVENDAKRICIIFLAFSGSDKILLTLRRHARSQRFLLDGPSQMDFDGNGSSEQTSHLLRKKGTKMSERLCPGS